MTEIENVKIPKGEIIKKLFLKNKEEVFYSNEAVERIIEKYDISIPNNTFRYHADKFVDNNPDIDKFKMSKEEVVWGHVEAIKKVKERFKL